MAKVTRLSLDGGGGLDKRRLHLREISDEADAPLDTVGQDLRKARQRKGEDLAQISSALKIRKGYLDALEQSNFEGLPGRAYAIGFVRSYAEYLGLDADQCVERLKIEIAGRDEDGEAKVVMNPEHERRLPQGSLLFVFLLLIAFVYGVYYLVSASRMQAPPVSPVPARLSAQPEPAPAPLLSPAPAEATQTASVTEPAATPAAAVEPPAPPPAPVAAPPPPAPEPPLPQGQKWGANNAGSRVTLLVHRPVRIIVLGPNKQTFLNRQLGPGDSYLLPNMSGLTLTTADSGAVEAIVDGATKGYVGGNGVSAEGLSLNPQDVVNRASR